jgi:hypothetical protein
MRFDISDVGPDGSDTQLTISTGRLTADQNAQVAGWVARLREDRPLKGHEPKGPVLRSLGLDDRPPVSLSDIIGSAVAQLLAVGVDELAVATYAARYRRAGRGPEMHKRADPVLFVLRGTLADRVAALPHAAETAAHEAWAALRREARERFPANDPAADGQRDEFVRYGLLGQGVPWTVFKEMRHHGTPYQIPLGTVARMAIDRLSRRGPDRVALDGYDFGVATHPRQHRLRHDAQERNRR